MKKAILVLVCVSTALILTGFAIFAAAGFTFINKGQPEAIYHDPVQKEQTAGLSQCSRIDLSVVNSQLTIKEYEGTEITLRYTEEFDQQWDYSLSGGVMKLEPHKRLTWGNLFSGFDIFHEWNHSKEEVTLMVPKNSSLSYKLKQVNGSGNLSGFDAESVDISCVNASDTLKEIKLGNETTFKNVNGSFNLTGCTADTLRLGLTNGGCTMDGCTVGSLTAADIVNADVHISAKGNPDDYGVKYHLTNGSVHFNGEKYSGSGRLGISDAAHRIDFDGLNSDLDVDFTK